MQGTLQTSIVISKDTTNLYSKSWKFETLRSTLYIRFHSNKTSKKYCHTRLISLRTISCTSSCCFEVMRQSHQNLVTIMCIFMFTILKVSGTFIYHFLKSVLHFSAACYILMHLIQYFYTGYHQLGLCFFLFCCLKNKSTTISPK